MPFDHAAQMQEYGFTPMDHDRPAYFEVRETPVFNEAGKRIAGHKLIERVDTGDSLAIHSESYRVIPDARVFGAFEVALNASKLDLTGLAVQRDRSHDGARMFSQYVLPAVTREINGAAVSLRFLFWNSYDGSRSASGRAGFFNWVCANQAVTGDTLNVVKFRHAGKGEIDIENDIEQLVAGAGKALVEFERMAKWPRVPVLDATAIEVFEKIPASSERLVADLNMAWTKAKDASGPNGGASLWGLYNVLTGWATHSNAKANLANVRVERQERIAKVMLAKPFAQLAEAA